MRCVGLARALCFGALVALGGGAGSAEEPEGVEAPFELRLHDVSALVAGLPMFGVERIGVHGSHEGEAPEHEGGRAWEGEEPILPFGTTDELIERAKTEVLPERWQREGADIKSRGWTTWVVREAPAVQEALGAWIAAREREAHQGYEVDVVAVPGVHDTASSPAQGAAAPDALEDATGIALACPPGALVSAFRGRRVAFLEHGGRVGSADAPSLPTRDGVVIDGLAVSVSVQPGSAPGQVLLELRADVGTLQELASASVAGGTPLDRPRLASQHVSLQVPVSEGAWRWVASGSDTGSGTGASLAVRVRRAHMTTASVASGHTLPRLALPQREARPIARRIGAAWSGSPHESGVWYLPELLPKGVSPAEPAELHSYAERLPYDAFFELVKELARPDEWAHAWSLERRWEAFDVFAPNAVVEDVEALLGRLAGILYRPLRMELRLVEGPATLDVPVAGTWGDEHLGRLAQAELDGAARPVASLDLRGESGIWAGRTVGRVDHVLRGHDVVRFNHGPRVEPDVRPLFEGLAVDARAALWSDGTRVSVNARVLHVARATPTRMAPTAWGDVALPEVSTLRWRTTCTLDVGGTCVLGSSTANGRRTWALLTIRRP